MPLLDDIFDTSPEIQRDRKLLDSLGIHLDFIRRVPTVQDEGQEEYAEHYGKHKYSSTQFNLPDAIAKEVKAFGRTISDKDLASDGREDDIHVTVKYGLHTSDPEKVKKIIKGFGPIKIKLGKVSLFPADEASSQRGGEQFDVVKIDVESDDLRKLNTAISRLEHTDTHPTYKPHVTVAYVKPRLGEKYVGKDFGGKEIELSELIFSDQEGDKTTIRLGNSEHYERGQPCKQGETSASTGCIKRDGNSDTSKSSDTKPDASSTPKAKTLTPKQLAQKILELSKDPVNLLDSPEKQKKLAALTFAVAAKISRFMFASFGAQPFKDFAAAVKVVAGLKEVKRGWKALSGKGEWTKEDGQALKKALYDIPAFAIPTAANWLLPTGPLFPMLYAHPKTKGWFAKELTDPTDDPINKALKKLESYFDDMEGKLVDKAGLNYARGFGLDLTPAGIRFLTDVLRLSYVDLHRMQAELFSSKGLQK